MLTQVLEPGRQVYPAARVESKSQNIGSFEDVDGHGGLAGPTVFAALGRALRTVNATVAAIDGCDHDPSVVLLSIAASGPDMTNAPQGPLAAPDAQNADFGTDDRVFQLRAELDRNETDAEPTYAVTYMAEDFAAKLLSSSVKSTGIACPDSCRGRQY